MFFHHHAFLLLTLLALGACSTDADGSGAADSVASATSSATGCAYPDFACAPGEFCHLAECGQSVDQNTVASCLPLPGSCAQGGRPVCACDGEVYPNAECALLATGLDRCYDEGACLADVSLSTVECSAPPGMFACRNVFCDIATEYCHITDCSVANWIQGICVSLPAPCSMGGCMGSAAEGITFRRIMGPGSCDGYRYPGW